MKKLAKHILVATLTALYVASGAAAATVEYVCTPIEMLTAHADSGMGRKLDRKSDPSIVLSADAGRTGAIVTIYENADPEFEEGYKVTKTDGSIRWSKEYSNYMQTYTLFTASMRLNRIDQFQTGSVNLDATTLTTYTCKLKGY